MRKIIYVLVVVSIAIVNTVFTIRSSDEIVDLVSLVRVFTTDYYSIFYR